MCIRDRFFLTSALLALLGGVAQINAIWNYGPFRVANVSSASQPDWYMGWPDGALRLFPDWEIRLGGYTVANVFFPGVLLIGAVSVSYTHLRAHETVLDLVCRLLLEKKKQYT